MRTHVNLICFKLNKCLRLVELTQTKTQRKHKHKANTNTKQTQTQSKHKHNVSRDTCELEWLKVDLNGWGVEYYATKKLAMVEDI